MKEHLLQIAGAENDPARRVNVIREYIQATILRSLHSAGAFQWLSFVGGTALRFVHGVRRFSEDLDFSVESEDRPEISPLATRIDRDLTRQGYHVTTSLRSKVPVQVIWVRVERLLYEVGTAGNPRKKLSVRVEIDTNAPAGAGTETTIVQRHAMFTLRHHDLPSLMAGKLNAILTRKYAKGRDWYDLVWYLSRRPRIEPNLTLLSNALKQSNSEATPAEWRRELTRQLDTLDANALRSDIEPFLEEPGEIQLLDPGRIRAMLAEG